MNEALAAIAVVVLAGLAVVSVQMHFETLRRRLDRLSRIEGKLDVVLKHFGLQFDPRDGLPPEALDALTQGRKIEAIKHYRRATGAGLAEAKNAIEEAMRRGIPPV